MCDYDGDYTSLRSKLVVTRKAHTCASCDTAWPAKTTMRLHIGISEGEFYEGRICPVCEWSNNQPDHSEMHLCMNWGYDPQDGYHRQSHASDTELFNYLRYCHENGEAPTATQLAAVVHQIRIAEGVWDDEAVA